MIFLCCLWDSKAPTDLPTETASYCVETSQIPPQDKSPSWNPSSPFSSLSFVPHNFREIGIWGPVPAFRSCSVAVAPHEGDHLMYRSGRKWSPPPTLLPSWNHSPLALFVVMLPRAHLTSLSGISGSKWVTTPPWSSGSLTPFWYSSAVYSCYLLLISSASVTSLAFLSFIVPILPWNLLSISLISSMRSLVFPILLFSCLSLHHSFKNLVGRSYPLNLFVTSTV